MTIPLWCLLGGVVLPYIWAGASLPFRSKQLGTVDLDQPRLQAAELVGSGAGAWGAQLNGWEALTVFMAVTLMAFMQGVDPTGNWALASMIWLGARVSHGVFYIVGNAMLRVLSFTVGMGMAIWIIVMAASA